MTRWDRKTALVTGLGAALAAGAGYAATRFFRRRAQAERHAPALKHGVPPGPLGDSGNIRSARTEAMRDPPPTWAEGAQASGATFPASDPSNLLPPVHSRRAHGAATSTPPPAGNT